MLPVSQVLSARSATARTRKSPRQIRARRIAIAGLLAMVLAGEGCWCSGDEQAPVEVTPTPATPSRPGAPLKPSRPQGNMPQKRVAPLPLDPKVMDKVEALEDVAGREDDAAFETYVESLRDGNRRVRQAAIEALEEVGNAQADAVLSDFLFEERDTELRVRAIEALEETAGVDGVRAIGEALSEERAHVDVKEAAIDALESIGTRDAAAALAGGLSDPDPDLRYEVVDALEYIEDPSVIPDLWSAYSAENDEDVRDLILDALETMDEDVEKYRE